MGQLVQCHHSLRHLVVVRVQTRDFTLLRLLLEARFSGVVIEIIVKELIADFNVVALVFFCNLIAFVRCLNADL